MILHAPSSRRRKGTELVIEAARGPRRRARASSRACTHDEARRHYEDADIVVDQLNAGWYGLFAVEAMALGKPVVSCAPRGVGAPHGGGARDRGADRPRDEGEPARASCERLVADPDERRRIGAASRAYVERVHDADRMADRLLEIYGRL